MPPYAASGLPAHLAVAALAIGCLVGSPPAASGSSEDVRPELGPGTEPIEACLRRNLPKKSSVQTVRFETTDRMGHSRTVAGKLYWKRGAGDRASSLIRLDDPPELRGSAYLLIERADDVDIFVYLPEYQKVRRITPHALAGSLFGTDFSYEDMRRLRHLVESTRVERLADADLGGRGTWAVRVMPPAESGYGQVLAWIDRETCVPLKLELYERGGALLKVLTADAATLAQRSGIWIASAFTLRDLHEQTETKLSLGAIEVDADLPDRLFSERTLAAGN
jgi:hypothetical protein